MLPIEKCGNSIKTGVQNQIIETKVTPTAVVHQTAHSVSSVRFCGCESSNRLFGGLSPLDSTSNAEL